MTGPFKCCCNLSSRKKSILRKHVAICSRLRGQQLFNVVENRGNASESVTAGRESVFNDQPNIDMDDGGEWDNGSGESGNDDGNQTDGSMDVDMLESGGMLDPETVMATDLYKISKAHGILRAGFEAILNRVNLYNMEKFGSDAVQLPSSYLCRKRLLETSQVTFTKYDACVNGCRMYLDDDPSAPKSTKCICKLCKKQSLLQPPVLCGSSLYNEFGSLNSSVSVVSVESFLKAKLVNKVTRQQYMYRHQRQNSSNNLNDIFDGTVYKNLVKAGEFNNEHDVAIGLSLDLFKPFDNDNHYATMVNMVVYNIHLAQRYKRHNMVSLMIIPATHKLCEQDTFLQTLFNELQQLGNDGMDVLTEDKGVIRAKVIVLTFTGGLPAVASLINHKGHGSYYGCRMCEVYGEHSTGMYFRGLATNYKMREIESYRYQQHTLGIKRSAVSFFPHFTGPSFFGIDELHLLGQGLARKIMNYFLPPSDKQCMMTRPDSSSHTKQSYPFNLDNLDIRQIGQDMAAPNDSIPATHFDGDWTDIVKRSGRVVDWLVFLMYVLPAMVVPHLVSKTSKAVMNNLVVACHMCLSWEIRPGDIEFIHWAINKYHGYLETNVANGNIKKKCQSATTHYLGHMAFIIRSQGPMPAYSCRSLERSIGFCKKENLSLSRPGASLQKYVETQLVLNYRTALDNANEDLTKFDDNVVFADTPTSKAPTNTTEAFIRRGLAKYFIRSGVPNVSGNSYTRSFFKKMQRDGKVFTSTWLRPNEPAVVSISFPSNELYQKRCFFGLVQFYCNISYDGQSFDLAAVKALRKVDQDQKCLRGAFHDEHVDGRLYPVWSYNNNGTQNVHDKLIFIDANQIIDAVATPPETKNTTIRHLITPKQFIWEYKVVSNIDLFQLYA